MPISRYLKELRHAVGNRLLLVPSVGAIVHNEAGEILIQRTTEGSLWSLPGGAIDPGETPSEAVVREVAEETGLIVRPTQVIAVLGGKDYRYTYANNDRVEYVITVFACTPIGGTFGQTDEETEALEWFAPEHIPTLTLPYPAEMFRIPPSPISLFA